MTEARGKKVVLGMSGGVDSSVAAARLLDQGYDVQGLFMKNWDEDDGTDYCTAIADFEDAQQVADKLRQSISQKLRQQQQEIRDIQQDLEICNYLLAKRDESSDQTLLNLLNHSIPSPRKQSRRTPAEQEHGLGYF